MLLLLLVLGLVCICYVDIVFSHDDLINVAYSKPVTLSTKYDLTTRFQGSNAVNGLITDLAATYRERHPWLRIDLGASFKIHEIEVFARTDCCGNELHDVDFKVGGSIHHMHRCGHYTGPTVIGQRIAVFCPHNTIGRYVQIQIVRGNSNILTPGEVLVWGRIIPSASNDGPVKFYVYMSYPMTNIVDHHTLVVDAIKTNSGNGFHSIAGIFTVPSSGFKVFTWTLRVHSDGFHGVELVVNGQIVGALFKHTGPEEDDMSSTTVVIHVSQGEDVLLRTKMGYNQGEIYSNAYGYSSFAGWKLN